MFSKPANPTRTGNQTSNSTEFEDVDVALNKIDAAYEKGDYKSALGLCNTLLSRLPEMCKENYTYYAHPREKTQIFTGIIHAKIDLIYRTAKLNPAPQATPEGNKADTKSHPGWNP